MRHELREGDAAGDAKPDRAAEHPRIVAGTSEGAMDHAEEAGPPNAPQAGHCEPGPPISRLGPHQRVGLGAEDEHPATAGAGEVQERSIATHAHLALHGPGPADSPQMAGEQPGIGRDAAEEMTDQQHAAPLCPQLVGELARGAQRAVWPHERHALPCDHGPGYRGLTGSLQ